MKHLLLTLDYELYGDGSGNVFQHIIKPTEAILAIAEAHNVHLTIFFEVMEYWRLKEQWELGNRMGYTENPIEAMEAQLRKAYGHGHDVQLHLHPQWANAKWKGDHWEVDNAYWRLSVLSQDEIEDLLHRGRQTLEDIIGCSQYKCDTLRAGGYNVQPSENIVRAMRNCGFRADSSIYPGGCEQGALSLYDYRSVATDRGMWHCGDSLETEVTESDITELPIVAFPMMRLKKYMSFDRVRAIWRNRHSATKTFAAKTSTGGGIKQHKINKLLYFFSCESQTWDYCLFSKGMHRSFLRKIRRQNNRSIFVLVGHPKSFVSGSSFEYLLRLASKEQYSFSTISEMNTIESVR